MLKKSKTYFFATFCLFLIVALIFFSFYVRENAGIQSIRFYNKGDKVCIKIKYVDCMGYSVETMKNNDIILIGERVVNSSDFIGKNAIELTLYESKIGDKLKKDYNTFEVYNVNLKGGKTSECFDIKFMLCPSAEHSLKIYVGFDDAFQTFVNEYTKINNPLGTIRLELGEHK